MSKANNRSLFVLSLFDQGIVSGGNFFLNILLARFLGAEKLGDFTLIWLVVLFVQNVRFSLVSAQMLNLSSLEGGGEFVRKSSYLELIYGLSCFFLSLIGFYLLTLCKLFNFSVTEILLISGSIFFIPLQDHVRRAFILLKWFKVLLFTDAVRYLLPLGLMLLFYLKEFELNVFRVLGFIIVSSVVSIAFLVPWLLHSIPSISEIRIISKRLWASSRWLLGSSVLQWLSGNFFLLVSGVFLSRTELGIIKSAQSILGVSHVLLKGLENYFPKQMGDKLKEGFKEFKSFIWNSSGVMGGVMILGVIVSWFFGDFIMEFAFGKDFIGTGYFLVLYSIVYLLNFLVFPIQSGLKVMEYTKPIFISYIVSSIVSLIVFYPLLDYFKGEGAVVGIILVNFSVLVVNLMSFSRINNEKIS